MKASIQLLLFFLVTLAPSFVITIPPYVDPQTGENMWGLVAREGDAIDYLLDKSLEITATLNNTYNMAVDIDNKADLLLAQSLAITATLDNTYDLLSTINTTINGCCVCEHFIRQADIPAILTTAGHYCLVEDVIGTGIPFSPITIAGSDILLNLQDHTVRASFGDAIFISSGSNVRITGGTVTAPNGAGVRTGFSGSLVFLTFIDNIIATGCQYGFFASLLASGINYTDCFAISNSVHGFYQDVRFGASHAYERCKALSNGSDGFLWDNSSGTPSVTLNVIECMSERNSSRGFHWENIDGIYISTSYANGNIVAGFESPTAMGGLVEQCIAINNGVGFRLATSTSRGTTIMSCKAFNNVIGIEDDSTNTVSRNRLFNNYAKGSTPFFGVPFNYVIGGGSQTVVIGTSDLTITNSSNVSWWTNMDGDR